MIQKSSGALLNEYKGYLFEFLVCKELRNYFLLTPIETVLNENQFTMLSQQESFVRNNYPSLIKQLPVLAKETANRIWEYYSDKKVENILLSGKQNTSLTPEHFSEEDIGIFLKDSGVKKISLKLAKKGLATNTKSSGILSILKRYFDSLQLQAQFNDFIDIEFEHMSRDLHTIEGIEYRENFKNWKDNELPELPGQLNRESSERLKLYYQSLAKKLYELTKEIDVDKLKSGLARLSGFSHPDIVQVTCFYIDDYLLAGVSVKEELSFEGRFTCKQNKSSVVFQFDRLTVLLRIKPMNLFTSKAYKVNASIEFAD
ncbi:MAG: hypothetical protein CME65_14205 [Halobacteriovoraceae bacterium]|nr:hypothetical protein [Halobacteriovoraceae bacterium]